MNRDIQVWTIKDNYRLGSDIHSKVLALRSDFPPKSNAILFRNAPKKSLPGSVPKALY
jgi:hypothetical protein